METRDILVSQIVPDPDQPRKIFTAEHIQELAASMKAEGQKTPVIVYEAGNSYHLVVGECRWRAAKEAGMETLRAEINDAYADPKMRYKTQLIENTNRADLPPMDQAQSFRDALLRDMDLEEIALTVGKSVSKIAADIEMASIKDAVIRRLINDRVIPLAIGRELSKFPDNEVRDAWNETKDKGSVKKMQAALDRFRQKNGQLKMDIDYSQDRKDLRPEIKAAAKAFQRWENSTNAYFLKIAKDKKILGFAAKAREAELPKLEAWAVVVKKRMDDLLTEIANCGVVHDEEKIAATA